MSEIRVNNITNRTGISGPEIGGIPVIDSNSHFVVPTGRTGQRYADEGENIVRDGLVLYLDAKHSYPSKTGIGTTTSGAANTNPLSSTDVDVNTWYDMSGYENHGELIGGVGYNSGNGGSLVFDASNDRVECGNADSLNFGLGSFSVDVWLIRGSNPTVNLRALSKGGQTDNADQAGFAIFISGSSETFQFIVNPSGIRTAPGGGTLTINQWTNIVGVWDKQPDGSAIVRQYKNGTLVGSATTFTAGSVSNSSFSLTLGSGRSNPNTPNLFHDGNIASVKMYNKALTAAEVLQNYNATRSRFQ